MDTKDEAAFEQWYARNQKRLALHLVPDDEVKEIAYEAYSQGFNRGYGQASKEYQVWRDVTD